MPTCAVCESVQAGGEACDVCGRPFPAGEATPVPVEPLEGLEATSVDPVPVVVDAMEGLEPTGTAGIPDDGTTTDSPVATCRYCRNPAPAGEAFCPHCGMRLPPASGAGSGASPPEVILCRDCAVPVRGSSCPACGARVSS